MLSTNFTLYDYNVSGNYIYCQINAQVEYHDDAIVGENKVSGYGEPVKMLFIKTNDGYKIADWYSDSTLSYDQINRGLVVSMNDPDVWLKSSSASILNNCEEYQDCLEASLQSTAALAADVSENSVAKATRVDFNRSAMATYALNNCSKTNPSRGSSQVPEYKDFSTVSSTSWDCTNFISHVMLSGGAPVYNNGVNQSTTGWYNVYLNNKSSSWSGVEQFHTYITNNYTNHNKGPSALSSVYYSNIEFSPYSYNSSLGNVIQINYGGATFGHSTVITGFIQNEATPYLLKTYAVTKKSDVSEPVQKFLSWLIEENGAGISETARLGNGIGALPSDLLCDYLPKDKF